ncbi:MAG: urease accessory protein UreF [Spirochaetes bacterium]|nr:urease accessory protein UreF [Spirochaetota bacterium]
MDIEKLFLLLQVNDASFPIGGYTHSLGLETYIQQGNVTDAASAKIYIQHNLKVSFLYTELLPASIAYDAAVAEDLNALAELENLLYASKSPKELREASLKLGSRFAKTSLRVAQSAAPGGDIITRYMSQAAGRVSHAVAYAVFSAACNIEKENALAAYLYAQSAAMVTVCVKTVPLSQTDGQIILSGLHGLFAELLVELKGLSKDDLCRNTPGMDIASMQHERLYSRLYIS